jgi:hypothetical protein
MCSTRARKAVAGTPVERGHGGLCGSGLVLVKPATSRAEGRGYVGVGHPHLRPAVGHVQDGARGRGSGVRALARAGETRLRDHHCGTRGEGRSLRREGIAGRAPSTFCGALPAAADRVTKVAWLLFRRGILCTSWTTGVCSSLIFELLSCMGLYPMYIHAYHSSHKTPQICCSDRTI